MGRPRLLNETQIEKLRFLVVEKFATPSEVATILGVSRNTAYNYIHELGLPIRVKGDHLKFYDPSWTLRQTDVLPPFQYHQFGVWVSTSDVPKHEAHPKVWRDNVALPLSVLILAQHVTRRVINLHREKIVFKDGNVENVDPSNLALDEDTCAETLALKRMSDLIQCSEAFDARA